MCRPSRERQRAAEVGELRKSNIHVPRAQSPQILTSGRVARGTSSRGRSSPRLGPPCMAPGTCLKLPTPSLTGNGLFSCLRAAEGDRGVSKERSGGIAGLSARGLPIACPTTARRASAGTSSIQPARSGIHASLGLRRRAGPTRWVEERAVKQQPELGRSSAAPLIAMPAGLRKRRESRI